MRWRLGLRPRPRLGGSYRPPDPLHFRGAATAAGSAAPRRRGEGEGGGEGEGREGKGGEGKGGKGRGREEDGGGPPRSPWLRPPVSKPRLRPCMEIIKLVKYMYLS